MDFGEALEALHHGKKVTREGWNGKGQFIFQMLSTQLARTIEDYFEFRDWNLTPYKGLIVSDTFVIVTKKNIQVGWLASQADMLANDWEIIN